MYDVKAIEYRGMPLFQTAKMVSPHSLSNTLEDMACFFYVIRGAGEWTESNGKHRLKKKEGLVKSCGNFISSYYKDEEGYDFEAVVVYFYPDVIKGIYEELSESIGSNFVSKPPIKVVDNSLIEKFIASLQLYFENDELIDENLARLKVKELVMILLKSNYYDSISDLFDNLFNSPTKSFRQIVNNNILSNITIEQLAFLTNKSLSTFKRAFTKEFNDTPAKYIKRKRLEKATEALCHTEDSISNIAFDCGFQDLSTFSSVFKQEYQVSPTEYRLAQTSKSLN